jgi:hypothetical protein
MQQHAVTGYAPSKKRKSDALFYFSSFIAGVSISVLSTLLERRFGAVPTIGVLIAALSFRSLLISVVLGRLPPVKHTSAP